MGFLVWDSRADDDFVTNTKAELLKNFEYPRSKDYRPPKPFRTSPGSGGTCPS
ncbi:hypothetical protein ACFV9W_07190 [Streptomyces sp. NPDC059897]|uniref:hypothetical protein n=1 Tax=Streptomyces sp. NPDC059897 TaxID=3346994 RepID=UPI003663447D